MSEHSIHPSFDKTTHGYSHSRTYKSWQSMKSRCLNPNSPDFLRYGGRGITVHCNWVVSFEAFLADMGERPEGLTLDRINNSIGYSPDNCRWVSRKNQSRNRSNNNLFTIGCETKCMAEWGEIYGISRNVIWSRINNLHWTIHNAITTPLK